MIHVPREPRPAHLDPAAVTGWAARLCDRRAEYYRDLSDFERHTRPKPPNRPQANKNHYGHHEVREALKDMFGSKCAYCEGEVAATSPQHVEHYRPASRYPALAYEWENLLLACPHCNSTYKSDRFPVAPAGNTPKENRRAPCARTGMGETPLLLNPCDDLPERHLTFRDGRVVALSDRGRRTRRVCGLNRDDLLTSRCLWLKIVQRSIEEYRHAEKEGDFPRRDRHADDLSLFVYDGAPYAGMVRAELTLHHIDWRSL